MDSSANGRDPTTAALDKVAGGAGARETDHTTMMNVMANIMRMLQDSEKNIIGDLR